MGFRMRGFSGFGSPFDTGKGASKIRQNWEKNKGKIISNAKQKVSDGIDGKLGYHKLGEWVENKITKSKPNSNVAKFINFKNKIKNKIF